MGRARHQPHGELAGERLRRLLVHGREHVVEQHAERVLARVHGRDDARFRAFSNATISCLVTASCSHCRCLNASEFGSLNSGSRLSSNIRPPRPYTCETKAW